MNQFEDAKNLIAYCKKSLPLIVDAYNECLKTRDIKPELLIMVKNFTENLRSALDYSAYGIFLKYGDTTKPRNHKDVYFPWLEIGGSENDYRDKFKKCMPGVEESGPRVFEVFKIWQPFSEEDKNNNWLPIFMGLNNKNKHTELAPQEIIQQRHIRMGTVVASKISIMPGGRFIGGDGKDVPPGEYDADNLPTGVAPGFAEAVIWESIHFSSNKEKVLSFLKNALEKIEPMVHKMAAL